MSSPPEEDIRRTLARYCMLCDDGRFDDFAELFAENAILYAMGHTIEGRDAIRDFMEKSFGPDQRGKQASFNPLIEVDGWGGTAKAWSDFMFVDGAGAITNQGRFYDELEREGDKVWRFKQREIVFHGDAPVASQPPPG
jgi:3-phenylpropionate/cinnamic acid dioxygenase small subunit